MWKEHRLWRSEDTPRRKSKEVKTMERKESLVGKWNYTLRKALLTLQHFQLPLQLLKIP